MGLGWDDSCAEIGQETHPTPRLRNVVFHGPTKPHFDGVSKTSPVATLQQSLPGEKGSSTGIKATNLKNTFVIIGPSKKYSTVHTASWMFGLPSEYGETSPAHTSLGDSFCGPILVDEGDMMLRINSTESNFPHGVDRTKNAKSPMRMLFSHLLH